MGLFNSEKMHPVQPALGLNPAFVRNEEETLVLRERVFSFTGDDFSVQDTKGRRIIKARAKLVSMHDSKEILDANGNFLFKLRSKKLAIHKTFVAEDKGGVEVFRVSKHISLTSRLEVDFTNASDGRKTSLTLTGNMFMGGAEIKWDGSQTVAKISKHHVSMREFVDDKQTYYVTVAPGVDLALIAAVCICFDEIKHDGE
ncbi:hypothetical protein Q8F55_006207 [Vanrija albida]|uniref:Tubby C-terminal domain-containing protein n=1 Tax=Vanrija albida TaxID=181172 RepID=A0ABR3PWV0_9TREE